MNVVINSRTGETADYTAWVAAFADVWRHGRSRLDEFMDLLSPDVRLIAPMFKPTVGRAAGERAFRRAFDVLPDLTAEVHQWSASGEILFIEMTFSATVAGRRVIWPDVDRFLFKDGYAVERVAYFDPSHVKRAYLRGPSGWWQLLRRILSRFFRLTLVAKRISDYLRKRLRR